ncbi:DinB family protein [Dactylosporangium fulvum]|uniref:DinB family protein n=1 Tax=Dactylosporangium fulvum TaxID=53359 RepID=A0ABY5VMK2_9ACTN|nr:DinB family protein [Dactylosporangium fulvum]UWP78918.1 DinB family protein [Dactylosporangium fulvum]
MTDDTVLDTTIHEPSRAAGEVEVLLFALDRSRAQFAWKCGGLDAAGLNRPQPPSTMTIGGLLKHMALVEELYTINFTGEAPGPPLDAPEARTDPGWVWRSAADDTPEELYRLWRGAVEHSRVAMAKALADGGLDQPAKYATLDDGTSPNLRRVVVDLHDEYARHVGHADLLREAVDGLVGEDPPQEPPAVV